MNKRYMIPGPFHGVVSDLPSATDRQAFDTCVNLICRKGRLISRPALTTTYGATPDGFPILGMQSFLDINGNYHTCVLTKAHIYDITSGWVYNVETGPGGVFSGVGGPGDFTLSPYYIQPVNNSLYCSNGSNFLFYMDGSGSYKVAGNVPGGCRYLAQNAAHTIGASWRELGFSGTFNYPRRVRWSDSGNPNQWVTSPNTTAGVSDIPDISDVITGLRNLNTYTYITRTNGFHVMYPTGVAAKPFQIEPAIVSLNGVGNFYPYSLDSNGNYLTCISQGDIIRFDGSNISSIARGKALQSIFNSIGNTNQFLVQGKLFTSLAPTFDFESYWIMIPNDGAWIYSFNDDAWTRITSSIGAFNAIAYVITT